MCKSDSKTFNNFVKDRKKDDMAPPDEPGYIAVSVTVERLCAVEVGVPRSVQGRGRQLLDTRDEVCSQQG